MKRILPKTKLLVRLLWLVVLRGQTRYVICPWFLSLVRSDSIDRNRPYGLGITKAYKVVPREMFNSRLSANQLWMPLEQF